MRVLITGGTGFVGLRLARRLLELGSLAGASGGAEELDELVVVDAAVPDPRPAGLDGVTFVAGDVGDPGFVACHVEPGSSVFHLASVLSGGGELDFDLALRVNLDGGRAVLEACRAAGAAGSSSRARTRRTGARSCRRSSPT